MLVPAKGEIKLLSSLWFLLFIVPCLRRGLQRSRRLLAAGKTPAFEPPATAWVETGALLMLFRILLLLPYCSEVPCVLFSSHTGKEVV